MRERAFSVSGRSGHQKVTGRCLGKTRSDVLQTALEDAPRSTLKSAPRSVVPRSCLLRRRKDLAEDSAASRALQ